MELPRGLGEIRVGSIGSASVETPHGVVDVEAMGYTLRLGSFQSRWLRPRSVSLTRPDGQTERAPVRDGLGRVEFVLVCAGLFVTIGCFVFGRRA